MKLPRPGTFWKNQLDNTIIEIVHIEKDIIQFLHHIVGCADPIKGHSNIQHCYFDDVVQVADKDGTPLKEEDSPLISSPIDWDSGKLTIRGSEFPCITGI